MFFTTFLASTLKPQSIKVYLFGVRNLHLEHGFQTHYQMLSNYTACSAALNN